MGGVLPAVCVEEGTAPGLKEFVGLGVPVGVRVDVGVCDGGMPNTLTASKHVFAAAVAE